MQSRLRPLCAAKVLKKLQLPKLLVPHLDKICLRELGVAGQAPIEIEITGTRGAQRWGYAPSGRTELYP